MVQRFPVNLRLEDIAEDGRALLSLDTVTTTVTGHREGEPPRELSWLDATRPFELTADGEMMLFNELGDAAATPVGSIAFVRKLDGSPAVRLIDSWASSISPDGSRVIALDPAAADLPEQLLIVPVGAGSPKVVPRGPIEIYKNFAFFPDGKRLLHVGIEPGARRRLYVQDVDGGDPRAVTPPGTTFDDRTNPISADGKWVIAFDDSGSYRVFSLESAQVREIPGLKDGDQPLRWTDDERIFILRRGNGEATVFAVDLDKGRWEPFLELRPSDPAGVGRRQHVILTADGRTYVHTIHRRLSRLFLVDGLR